MLFVIMFCAKNITNSNEINIDISFCYTILLHKIIPKIQIMDNFIVFLDKYKNTKEIQYTELSNIFYFSHLHYAENQYYDKNYTGANNTNMLNNKTSYISAFPKSDYYFNHSTSVWNNLTKSVDANNNIVDVSNNPFSFYEEWLQKHEYDVSFNSCKSLRSSNKIPLVVKEKTKISIDISVKCFADILQILNENTYNEECEYNIDLKALSLIKTELMEMDKMIGMVSFKNAVLDQLLYFIQNLHLGKNSDFKHTIICGPPGTGKTEIAKILGQMYSKIGVLTNNVFKKVTRSDLIAGYLGQTALKTKKVITECIGGCLFIDEAYSLGNNSDNGDSYSKECVDTLCEAMSDHKDDLMIIIAGYENELNDTFFKANRGLESRFIWRFKIEDYSAHELMLIFKKKVFENEWSVESEDILTEKWFEPKKQHFQFFGRDMELLFSFTKIAHGRRIYGKNADLRKKISLADMDQGFKIFLQNTNRKQKDPSSMYGLYV